MDAYEVIMKNEFKALNQRIRELTQLSQQASERSKNLAIAAQILAVKARACLHH
jgi:hypothetical protein